MKGPRPADLPDHIDEDLIFNHLQSICEMCGKVQQSHVDKGAEPVKAFREAHKDCNEDSEWVGK